MLIDMDAYFASIEQKSNPHLLGKPIGVIGSGKRTIITTASYEARAHGVKTGMNIYEAKSACPEIILVVGNNRKYTHTCSELSKIYKKYTPDVEVYSVDEAFLDVTDTEHLFGGAMRIGAEIKSEIKRIFGINATIGISYNKLMAKLVSDLSKPDGLRMLTKEDTAAVLADLPTKELWGIGRHTAEKLKAIGINTCGELGRASSSMLRSCFGIIGERLKAMGQGIYDSSVSAQGLHGAETKSIGHSMTLPGDIWRKVEIEAYLLKLSEMVGARARKHKYMGSVITVTIRYKSFETYTRQKKLKVHTNDSHSIFLTAMEIIKEQRLKEPIRLLGVSLSGLTEDTGQVSLFEASNKRRALLDAVDSINDRYGRATVGWALYALMETGPGVISPAWRPHGIHKGYI
ncbi:DNA polymerase IV [Candidatus Magnetomonas plexicatena]|uniref:DNA polymerase IV n=1 Tax=Candidatus Magnetomonas plexicatena TaxID=2552947 RepID=UPI0040328D99